MKFDEVIPQQDQELITDFIEYYGSAYNIRRTLKAPLSHIMRNWEAAKNRYLYRMFGNEMILSKDYEYGASFEELRKTMYRELCCNYFDFRQTWTFTLEREMMMPRNALFYDLLNLVSAPQKLTKNQAGFNLAVPLPNGKVYKIQENTKVAKVIQKISTAYGIEGYEPFLLKHSQILNTPLRKGKLCLSIHPLDYLTMSENTSWSSCMKWSASDGGEYRQGTVEMMNSSCVVCAYFYWDEFSLLNDCDPNHYWNNKRWRKLFIVSKDFIVGVRGYPYEQEAMDAEVIHWLQNLAEENLQWEYDPTIITGEGEDGEYLIFEDKRGRRWEISTETYFMYNDFYYDHPMILGPEINDAKEVDDYTFNYSGDSQCMLCGGYELDYEDFDDAPHHVICKDCDPAVRCQHCGDYYPLEDMIEVDGELYCSICYDNYLTEEYYTKKLQGKDDMFSISLYQKRDNGSTYVMTGNDNQYIWVLSNNMDEFREEFPTLRSVERDDLYWGARVWAIDVDTVSDEILRDQFGILSREDLMNNTWHRCVRAEEGHLPF